MEITRTIRLRLRPDATQADLLTRTIAAYTWSFNAVAQYGWDAGIANGVELHKATYFDHRARTGLPAQLTCAARVKATEALKSAKALIKKGKKVGLPQSEHCAIRYDVRSYSIWFERNEVSLLALEGRVRLPFKVPAFYAQYVDWDPASADLCRDRKGRWWLHVVMQAEFDEIPANGEFVGVDLGIVKPATDSAGTFYGSDHWKVVEDRLFQLKRRLQAKGTKSAKRHLKKVSGRQKRFRRDCDHVLSKCLVRSVIPGTTLVFEDLTDIRGRAKVRQAQRRRLHGWSFHQLQFFTQYKADRAGVGVVYVDPRYTSQKCSRCGHVSRSNRRNQADFCCRVCHFAANADHNAAINIRANHIHNLGLSVNQPIVSEHGVSHVSGASSLHTASAVGGSR